MIAMDKIKPSRPARRRFDQDAVLQAVTNLFWQHGYEATSMADVLNATGLTAPSVYAAFGNKETLFRAAADYWTQQYSARIYRFLYESITLREALERMLLEAVRIYTSSGHPRGCFLTGAAANCAAGSSIVEEDLRQRRIDAQAGVRRRIERGVKGHDLPLGTDAERLARFVMTVLQGLHVQARDGATRAMLEAVVADAMQFIPAPDRITHRTGKA